MATLNAVTSSRSSKLFQLMNRLQELPHRDGTKSFTMQLLRAESEEDLEVVLKSLQDELTSIQEELTSMVEAQEWAFKDLQKKVQERISDPEACFEVSEESVPSSQKAHRGDETLWVVRLTARSQDMRNKRSHKLTLGMGPSREAALKTALHEFDSFVEFYNL